MIVKTRNVEYLDDIKRLLEKVADGCYTLPFWHAYLLHMSVGCNICPFNAEFGDGRCAGAYMEERYLR